MVPCAQKVLLSIGLIFGYVNREKRREVMFLVVPAACFFFVASSSNLTVGSRYILPQKDETKREIETAISLAKQNPQFKNQQIQAQQELDRMNQ